MNGAFATPSNRDISGDVKVLKQKGFKISAQKLPILRAGPIDEMTKKLGIAPPEMIFGDNYISVEHPESGWYIHFNAFDALDRVDKTGASMLQVAHSAEWQKSRCVACPDHAVVLEHHHQGIKDVIKPFDWSYSTDYRGSTSTSPAPTFATTTSHTIPLHLLTRPDPILFFEQLILYEDELADNGTTELSLRIRVMPDRLLLLSRFFLRLDDVVFRIRDTRVFVEFVTGEVIREYTAREEAFETVRRKLVEGREDVTSAMRDANRLVELLPIVEKITDRVVLL